MRDLLLSILAVCVVVATGCAPSAETTRLATAEKSREMPTNSLFVNRVWSVRNSNTVVAGTLYTFLSEGTLVITSPTSKPALGKWERRDGGLTMIEEGNRYPAEVVTLTNDEFRIRVNGPGEPVDIVFEPATR
jgi:hypothetical protein